MNYTKENTICVYSDNVKIISTVQQFADRKSFEIFYADRETDLIGVPYFLAIVDINKLGNEFFNYLSSLIKEKIIYDEKFISYSKPLSKLSDSYSKYFVIKENISAIDLEELTK